MKRLPLTETLNRKTLLSYPVPGSVPIIPTRMNLVNGTALPGPQLIKKQEDDGGGPPKDIKPPRTTLNRVPRSFSVLSLIAIAVDLSLQALA